MKLPSLGVFTLGVAVFSTIVACNKEVIINQVQTIQHGKCVITKSNASVNSISGGEIMQFTDGCRFTKNIPN
jgi:hypothetical protein